MYLGQVCIMIKEVLLRIKRLPLIHSNTAKPIAERASVNAAPHRVLSTMIKPIAALFWLLVVVPFTAVVVADVVGLGVSVVRGDIVGVEVVDVEFEVGSDVVGEDVDAIVLPAVAVAVERYVGGGTALEGSVRAPVPHGILSPVVG